MQNLDDLIPLLLHFGEFFRALASFSVGAQGRDTLLVIGVDPAFHNATGFLYFVGEIRRPHSSMRINHCNSLGPPGPVVRSTPFLQFIHIFLSDVRNLPFREEGRWEPPRFSPRTKVCGKLGVPVTLRMVRFVCGPALLEVLAAAGQVGPYLRENTEQGSIALPRSSVSHGELVEDGMHLSGTESSEIRKRVSASFDETSVPHNGGRCHADNFGERRDGWSPVGDM